MTLSEYAAAWAMSHDLLMRRLKSHFDAYWLRVLQGSYAYSAYSQEQAEYYAAHKLEADRLWREYHGEAS